MTRDWRAREERRQRQAAEFEAERRRRDELRQEHDTRYATVADRLKALEIDPDELRDYLAGLP